LSSSIVPHLGRLAAGGTAEQARLNRYARILAVVLAAFSALGVVSAMKRVPELIGMSTPTFEVTAVVTLVVGAVLLMWLAEQVSMRGLGNGALIILAFGLAGHLPHVLRLYLEMYRADDLEVLWVSAAPAMTAAFLALVVFVESARWRGSIRG